MTGPAKPGRPAARQPTKRIAVNLNPPPQVAATAAHMAKAIGITRDLGEREAPSFMQGGVTVTCALCGAVDSLEAVENHDPQCIWRRAREFVDGPVT